MMTTKTMTITGDADVNALYFQPSDTDVLETVVLARNAYFDLAANGELEGFDVLHAEPSLLAVIPDLPDAGTLGYLLNPRAA